QDDSLATYAARLTKEEGLINWSRPALSIHNQVRGLYPWPHAYTFVDGARAIVLRTDVSPETSGAPAGTVTAAGPHGIHVAAGGRSVVVIEKLQPEGKRPMSARDFLAGHPVTPGTVLGR